MGSPWDDFRSQMPVTRNWAYFDHAAVAPLTLPASTAIAECAQQAASQGGTMWGTWNRRREETRSLAAQLVGATPDEVALVHSTSEGIGFVAEGFPWQPGDNIVTFADEFPSNLYPWMNLASRGVETRRVPAGAGPPDLATLAAACDSRTRIVSISWVGYVSGWRHDLDRVADMVHSRGALLFVDVIQGLGAFPLNVQETPIDFFAADGHKWLLGPEGAGLLFVRRKHLELLRPLGIGWNSVIHASDFDRTDLNLKPSAARYEGGSPNSVTFLGLGESLKLLARYGIPAIAERILHITDMACRRLREIGAIIATHRNDPEHSSGIVTFEVPGSDPQAIRRRCLERRVALSCRSGRLRISPHAYVNEDDIERLIEAVSDGVV